MSTTNITFKLSDYESIQAFEQALINEKDEKIICKMIDDTRYSGGLKLFKKPSESQQISCVRIDPACLRFIKNPSLKVQKIVINKHPEYIRYISKPRGPFSF